MDRRTLFSAGLAAFFVLDVVLVVWAVRWTSAPVVVPGASVSSSPSASEAPSATRTVKTPTSPSASPSSTEMVATPLRSFLVAASATEAWAAEVGTCDEPGMIAVTDDGGSSWAAHSAPGSITRIRPSSGTAAFVIGGDDGCDLRLWTSDDAARSWSDASSAAKGWARVPGAATDVHTPRDEVARPCGNAMVLDLSADGGTRATALCRDGELRVTVDNGQAWRALSVVPGAQSVSGRPDGSGVVAAVVDGCSGTVVQPYDGAELGKAVCVAEAKPIAGRTSVSASGPAVWLRAGDAVWRTPQLGAGWESAGRIR